MKTSLRLPLTALGAAALAFSPGCHAFNQAIDRASAEAPPLIKEKLPLRYYYGDVKGEKAKQQGSTVVFKDGRTRDYYLDAYDRAAGDAEKLRVRNEIVYELMTVIDQGYQDYEKAFKAGFAAKDVLLDSTHLAIDLTSTVMAPAHTKTVLSAIATGLGGVNASIDKNYFDQQSIEIVMLEMRSLRKSKEGDITGKLTQPVSQYPLSAAMRDLVEYYYCGSPTNALLSLQGKAAQPATKPVAAPKPEDETPPSPTK
jgi:hypothetical protein